MATIRCPNLKWRDGRPRWEPGPAARGLGFKGRDLKDEAGQWLGLAEAIAAAEQINDELAAFRASGKKHYRPKAQTSGRTCRALFAAWQTSVRWERLAETTRRDYKSKLETWLVDGEFADAPVAALTKPMLDGYWQTAYRRHGHAMANGIVACVRAMLSEAERMGWIPPNTNPAKALALPSVPPRLVVWTPAELECLVATADRIGMPDIGDAVVLALNTAQRQSDVLAMTAPEIVGDRARFTLAQHKTGSRVSVPLTDTLAARLDAIGRRRRGGTVAALRITGPLVVRPDGRQYSKDVFAPRWREVRRQAALGCDEMGIAPMPTIATKLFLDLRDTAVTRLALAGCDLIEIRAISGHSFETITSIMKHYLQMDESMADRAIDKLRDWMSKEGIAV